MMFMTKISGTRNVKKRVLNVTSEFQPDQCGKNEKLLEKACKPTLGVEKSLAELQAERKNEDARLERKIGNRQ